MAPEKRIILILLIAFLTTPAFAQKATDNREQTPFYYMQEVGVNYSMNENTRFGKFADAVGIGATFGFGKEFTPLWGWRAMLGYNMNRGRSYWKAEANSVRFHNLELFADGTLDLTDWWFPDRRRKAFNLKGFFGLGYFQTFSFSDTELAKYGDYSQETRALFGVRGGLNASYKIVENFAVTMDASLNCIQDKFNGVVNKRFLDGRLNLELGCMWFLGKKVKRNAPAQTYIPSEVTAPAVVEKQQIEKKQTIVIVPIMAYIGNIPDDKVEKRRIVNGTAYIDFPVNEMNIYPAYRKNPLELQRIRESIDLIRNDTLVAITSMDIHGYASPEGSYHNNTLLALGRTLALKEYLKSLYRFDESVFSVESTPEDWAGLRKYVSESEMPDKESLLAIINSSLEPDAKERKIKSSVAASTYQFLLKEVYPALRHSDYTVHYTIRNLTVEEGREIIKSQPQALSLNEMFQVANSYGKGTREYRETFIIAARVYPENPMVNLNAACVALENKQIGQARHYLDKAGNIPEAIHARGVIEVIEGNYEKARALFEQSLAAGIEESEVMIDQLP